MRRNIESVLGPNPLMWCCPTVPPGNGLKYPLAEGDGEWIDLVRRDGRVGNGADTRDVERDGSMFENPPSRHVEE